MKRLFLTIALLGFAECLFAQVGYSDFKPINIKSGGLSNAPSDLSMGVPKLVISDVKFSDDEQDNVLSANERGRLIFKVINAGKGTANGLNLTVRVVGNPSIRVKNYSEVFTKLDAGAEQLVSVDLEADDMVSSGQCVVRVELTEKNGLDAQPVEVKINTEALKAPYVKVVDTKFLTLNSAGKLSKGEASVVRLLVQNTGSGVAKNVTLAFNSPLNVLPMGDDVFTIGTLQAGESRQIDFRFVVNTRYTSSSGQIMVDLSESLQKYSEDKAILFDVESVGGQKSVIEVGTPMATTAAPVITPSSISDIDTNVPTLGVKREHAYALVIGNEDYARYQSGLNAESNVEFARQDATSFANYAQKVLGVPSDNIQLLKDATAAQMKKSIELLSKLIKAENGRAEVYVYYAGHGFPDEQTKESYIIPVDVSGVNVIDGVKLDNLYAQLTQYPSKKVVVMLDACFSGGARNQSLLASRGVKIEPKKGALTGNIVVFSATASNQSALPYREKGHGMFTYFLLKELQTSRGEGDVQSWFNGVTYKVSINSLKLNQKEQEPQVQVSEDVANSWKSWRVVK